MKIISGLRVMLGAAMLLPGLGMLAGGTAQAAGPIVIGATTSESGPLAEDADYQNRGIELGIAEANAHGGWLGRKLALKLYDDKSDPGTAVRLYTRLITNDKVDLLLGPYSSGITQAIAPLVNKYQYATIEAGASLPDLFRKPNKWNFQGIASSLQYLEELLPIAKTGGATAVAAVGLKSAFSLACYRARVSQAQKLGMKMVYQSTYSLPQPDFAAIALAIKNAHPDVVIACSYYPDAVGLAQSLHNQGFAPHYLAETIGPVEAAFIKAVGPLANGIVSNTTWWANFKTPGNAEFITAYKAKYHAEPDYHAAGGYAAVEVLGAAVAATKSLNQAKLRDWLLHHPVPTVQGTFKVDAYGLATGFSQHLVQIQDGVIKLVTPPDLAQAKLLVPYPGQ
ncbi:MAG TPA: amino acid ABC transporter substrate-binding protein [Acetobacteraceae bacterium]